MKKLYSLPLQTIVIGLLLLFGSYIGYQLLMPSSQETSNTAQKFDNSQKSNQKTFASPQQESDINPENNKHNTALQTHTVSSEVDEMTQKREKYLSFLKNNIYYSYYHMPKSEVDKIPRYDRPDLAFAREFLLTMDPNTGTVPAERLEIARQMAKNSLEQKARAGIAGINFSERGPDNIGGRTRALMFDMNDNTNKKVWAGGVSGGLWFNNDITNSNSSWNKVSDQWDNLAITSIAQNPNNKQEIYVGTGEGWGNLDAVRGGGIWKSSNGGTTWTKLTSTIPAETGLQYHFYFIQKILITSNGTIYVAGKGTFLNTGGILKSTDGGASWSLVLAPRSGVGVTADNTMRDWCADLEIGADGTLYASFGMSSKGKIYRSTNAAATTWADITPTPAGNEQRIELAVAPANSSVQTSTVIYAVARDGAASGDDDIAWFKRSTDGGANWSNITIPKYRDPNGSCAVGTTPFTRGQAWYDLILAVHPTNSDLVIAGGVDIHRTTNTGTTWSDISNWTTICTAPYVHADIHALVFRPGNSNEIITGTDGGVAYSANAGNSSVSAPTFTTMNKNYNVTQFYACAMKNDAIGSTYLIGGTQDNGTLLTNSAVVTSATEIRGGDGAFCFIDQNQAEIQISSYVYNTYRLHNAAGTAIATLVNDQNTGSFINPADYDDSENLLYTARNSSSMYRIAVTPTGGTSNTMNFSSSLGASVTHVRVGRALATVFVGTNDGKVYKLTNTTSATATVTNITGTMGVTGSVSCIEIGASDNELLVTFSNYGVTSVWYTSDGGTTWTSKDEAAHGLPDMPVRWALFNPNNRKQVMLATESGVWTTNDITLSNPGWEAGNATLANTRCDMLQYRSIDHLVLVATHGRGFFTTSIFSPNPPPVISSFSPAQGTPNDLVTVVGSNFSTSTTGNAVSFNGANATVQTASATELTVRVPASATTGKITVTTIGGSSTSATNFTLITVTDLENATSQDIKVYPNPAVQEVFISTEGGIELKELYLIDLNGKIILQGNEQYKQVNGYRIDIASLEKGVYILKVITAEGEITKKIVKQ